MKNRHLHNLFYEGERGFGVIPQFGKVLGFRVGESEFIHNRTSLKSPSISKKNKDSFVEERSLEGNTNDTLNPLSETGHAEKQANHTVQEALTPIYKVALSVYATSEERNAFYDYRSAVEQAGWSAVSVPVSALEKSAFVIAPDNEMGKVRAATYVVESLLERALRGACREWR